MGAGLRVFADVKVGDVGLKRRVDLGHDRVPHPSNAHPLPQFTLLQGASTDRCLSRATRVTSGSFPTRYSLVSNRATKMRLCASYFCETRVCERLGRTADLFHSNFDLLKLCLPTEYRPRDVQPDNPHAICSLHKNTHTYYPQKIII